MALQDAFGIDGKTYSGQEMRLLVAGLTENRGGVSGVADLKATPNGTPDAKVQLAAGAAIVPATSGVLGSYEIPNDAAGLQSPAFAATGAQGRWDLLLLQVVAGVPTLVIVQGTAAGSPAEPSLAGQTDYIRIARIQMPPTTSVINNGAGGTIVDQRLVWPAYVPCTSTTRPPNPFDGQRIYETDTDRWLTWNGAAWTGEQSPQVVTSATRPTGSALYEGLEIYETDTDLFYTYTGSQWAVNPGQRLGSQAIGANAASGTNPHDCGTALSFTMPTLVGSRKVLGIAHVPNVAHGVAPTLHDACDVQLCKADNTVLKRSSVVLHGVFGAGYHHGCTLVAEITNADIPAGAATLKLRITVPTGTLALDSASTIMAITD